MADHVVGALADFPPGSHTVVKIRNLHLGVFNIDGEFHALPNICPHQFGPLCEGPVGGTTTCSADTGWRFSWVREGEILTCPWHGLEFDIATGTCLASPKLRVRRYPISVEGGEVVVGT